MSTAIVLFFVFLFAFAVELFFYLGIYGRLVFYKPPAPFLVKLPVSVIICAKNEAENLLENLPEIFNQEHDDFEVVVVNDCSVDETEDVLRAFADKHHNLKIVTVKENEHFSGGKKFALTLGIKAAKYDVLLLTDADCKPKSDRWIKQMTAPFADETTEIVLGYSGFQQQKGSLNKLIRFDAFLIAIQYLSHALIGFPYMGVGRNLAYRKSLFFKNKGFASHQRISSGDDDLFINEVAKKNNIVIQMIPESQTVSKAKSTFSEWFWQKRRHFTTGSRYKFVDLLLLALPQIAKYLFILTFIILIILRFNIYLIFVPVILRIFAQMLIFRGSLKQLGESGLLFLAVLLAFLLTLIYPILAVSNLIAKPKRWTKNLN